MKQIIPVQYVYNAPLANNLKVIITGDNLTSTCSLQYTLLNVAVTAAVTHDVTDDQGNITTIMDIPAQTTVTDIFSATLIINGEDYLAWNGNNDYPYTYVTTAIGVTLI